MQPEVSTTGADDDLSRIVEELKRELSEAHRREAATAEVLRAIGSSPADVQPVFNTIAESATRLCNGLYSVVFRFDGKMITVAADSGVSPSTSAVIRKAYPAPPGRGTMASRALLECRVIAVTDAQDSVENPAGAERARAIGYRAGLSVPMLRGDVAIGTINVVRREAIPFTDTEIDLLKTFADQAVIAIENTRMFNEIVQKSQELEIASQHKSQFVANMSHELRTPLAAILGYAELIQEGFYGALPEKSNDALTRIRSNGKHLLGLINTVLDIAKIESGQFSLNLGEYALENVVETVRAATEALAATKKLALKTEMTKRLPVGLGDEQRLTQVLLNLVGNAIKFTDVGEVRIAATASNDQFALSVTDTGPGIPQEHQARIFEQFHQVDSSNTKAKGGTGLGLAIAKQIVEMHGGRIWVESTPGEGATFQIELPIRASGLRGTMP